jgi:hypothetical protein
MMSKLVQVGVLGASFMVSSCFANCISEFKPSLDSREVTLAYWSKTPTKYYLQQPATTPNQQCATTFKEVVAYLKQNYRKQSAELPWVTVGWNYLALNKQEVYNPLMRLTPTKLNRDYSDFAADPNLTKTGYWVSNNLKYTPISIVNQQYGCYEYSEMTNVTGTAHPSNQRGLACAKAGNQELLHLGASVEESSVVSALVHDPYFMAKLGSAKLKPIVNLQQLAALMAQSSDDELACYADNLSLTDTSFAITSLNADATLNLKLGLNSDYAACSSLLRIIELKHVKAKLPMQQVISAAKL